MKKLLTIIITLLLLSTTAIAATVEFEEDYVKENEAVFSSLNGLRPFVSDLGNTEPVEDACYWLSDYAAKYNILYTSYLGELTSKTNYTYKEIVQQQGKSQAELTELNLTDKEWIKEFTFIKNTSTLLTDAGIVYGISIHDSDYFSEGLERDNHVQTNFEFRDFVGDNEVEYELYDNNNFAVIRRIGKTTYIIYQLEAYPREKTINWFNETQAKHSDKRAIIYTTSFLDKSGEMFTQHDWSLPQAEWMKIYTTFSSKLRGNLLNRNKPHDGINLWNKAFASHDNILLVVSSNDTVGTDIVTNTFTSNNGYPVVAVLANLNGGYAQNGNAYPLLIKVSEDNKTIDIRYAVPYFNKVGGYIKDTQKIITLDKVLKLPEPDPITLLQKVKAQSNGENVAYINGYENNLFKPNNNMTKAEACVIFARLLTQKQTIPSGYKTRFTDVKEGDWYYNAIAYLDETGYFYTTSGDKYNPNDKITRAEFVELAYFTSNLKAENSISFNDVTPDNKYHDAIMAAAASGLVNGYGDGSFKPNATITRAEVVTVINRLISLTANEKTVSKKYLSKIFSDISGHWAEYQILMAANDKVRSTYSENIDKAALKENDKIIYFENEHIKVAINKKGGVLSEVINKANGENVLASSTTPWFTYLLNSSNAPVQPKTVEIVDGRLKVVYKNDFTAYFVIDVKENYFSVTLDTGLPSSVLGIVLCHLPTNAFWELDNPEAFAISAIPMTTTVNIDYYPGGSSKIAKGSTYSYLGVTTLGAKVGVAFSRMTEHRAHLKCIADDINPNEGITSTHGGAYAYDNPDIYYDYVITGRDLNASNAEQTAKLCKEYSVEQLDIHKSGQTFIQGDFNFVCARTSTEKLTNKFIDGETFKKRIGSKFIEEGVQLSLHTYSSVVNAEAHSVLSVPQYQQDIVKAPTTWTVRGSMSKGRTNIKTYEDASNFEAGSENIPYNTPGTKYVLIDEEIILVQQGTSSGFLNVKRGQCGTTATTHEDGAKIYQLYGWYNGFQPKPLSSLFYKVAELTAKAYNDGGFEMIYLDGLESFARDLFSNSNIRYYAYAEFVRTVVSNCEKDPLIEFSTMQPCLWSARARGGAIDYARRAYKNQKTLHLDRQKQYLDYFYTATVGWFSYCPDAAERYKDTGVRTLHRDDMDHMGSLALAYNFGTVCDSFSIVGMNDKSRRAPNFMYYGLYTRLREGNYFSPEVKQAILEGEYEYKIIKLDDGSWAFREMSYARGKIFDLNTPALSSGKVSNPFDKQTPFIRIEQKYSTEGKDDDKVLVFAFDESKNATDYMGTHKTNVNIEGKIALKLRVYGNGSSTDAILISLSSPSSLVESGRYDYFVPLNFDGWKEIVLVEANNEDYDGYSFSTISYGGTPHNLSYRNKLAYSQVVNVQVSLCGSCSGAKLGSLYAYTPADSFVKNPSVTVGDSTITFNTELHSSEYIEYYPEENKAYLYYYTQLYNSDGTWRSDEAHTKEIDFEGALTVPSGSFTFKYDAEPTSDIPVKAQVVFGFGGKTIKNPDSWTAPEIDMPKDIEKVAIY